jgi:hypothetical protein
MTARPTIIFVFQPEAASTPQRARLLHQHPMARMTREPRGRVTGPWSPLQHVHPRMHREVALDAGHAGHLLGR